MNFRNDTMPRRFRSSPGAMDVVSGNIDAENGILYDVVMCEEGPADGHGVELDADFISALVAYDRKYFGNIGLKARFGHPSMSSEAMGTQLGVFRKFRKREKNGKMQAIADLHLLEASEASPTHPGMRSWVLQMAAERPDFIMSSIVFKPSGYFRRKANGHKVTIEDEYDNEGLQPATGPIFVAFDEEAGAAHYFTDLVENGAATDNLFAANHFSPNLFVSQVHQFLADNPHIQQFIHANPEKVQTFLSRIGISFSPKMEQKESKPGFFATLFGGVKPEAPEQQFARSLDAMAANVEALQSSVTALKESADALKVRVAELAAALKEAETRIAALETAPAATATGGETVPAPASEKRSYQTSPMTLAGRKAAGYKD